MRAAFVGLCVTVMMASTSALAQGRPGSVNPLSLDFSRQAQASLAAGKTTEALDLFEASVVADPRNTAAYIGLGRTYQQLGMPGRALRYYRQALTINPNDPVALELQAIGFAASGMSQQATANLQRLRRVCASNCTAAIQRIDAAIAKGPVRTTTAAAKPAPATAAPTP